MDPAIDAALRKQAQPIIDRYAHICSPAYIKTLKRCIADLENAAQEITRAQNTLSCSAIDPRHWADTSDMVPWFGSADPLPARLEVARAMSNQATQLTNTALALKFVSDFGGPCKDNTDVPWQFYVSATKELIALYESKVGRFEYADPRRLKDGAYFVASCLKQIDPGCKIKNAITCLRQAREWGVARDQETKKKLKVMDAKGRKVDLKDGMTLFVDDKGVLQGRE